MILGLTRPQAISLAASAPRARRSFSTATFLQAALGRTNNFNSGFTSSYDPGEEGRGPMFSKTCIGVPQFYPRDLKKRVDEYVVGQDRAKKTISATIFNHYQNLRWRQYKEEQERKRVEKTLRQAIARDRNSREREPHPPEGWHDSKTASYKHSDDHNVPADEGLFHHDPIQKMHQEWQQAEHPPPESFLSGDFQRSTPIKIDKSNILLLGPTGVGKTYILEILSKKINVPFTICDCNSFTQAGYIGQDVETCIERLLIEAKYDIAATEHGIVVLDEFDKIAKRETMHGRDVGGEGVQQALLKLVEGTKVTINVKDNRHSRSASPITTNYTGPGSSASSSGPQVAPPTSGKVEQCTIDTTNILFVMCGAFVGLDKLILNRVSKSTMGFGSELRNQTSNDQTDLPPSLFAHLPHRGSDANNASFTALDLTTPEDLQRFGFIPELIGRVHNIVALSPLSRTDLLRILTEPKNCLVAQYTALFETYPSKLFFTQKALAAIAERAEKARTGARGLKMEMERILAEPMFDAPMPYVLVTEKSVRGEEKVGYWGKDGRFEVQRLMQEEDGEHVTPLSREQEQGTVGLGQFREAGLNGA
ncbi:ATP-dependent Clp protease [Xylaria sp. CBS 124048]|nr:ATP-dependent Clp protease [Xylaria sp. CBS 124048]